MTAVAAPPTDAPLPPDWRLRPAPGLRTLHDGTVLMGGAPLRVLRVTAAGAAMVGWWWDGGPVGDGMAGRRLARRLLDAGLAEPEPGHGPSLDDLTVVIPVQDRPEELRRCLAAIDRRCRVVVVDDGSRDRAAIATIATAAGAASVRLAPARGPAAARNAGMRAGTTPFVAFVDSDCVVGPDFPGRLLAHLADPALAIAAPRIVALAHAGDGWLTRYEAHHSTLDMGAREGLVAPGTAIPYTPSAALLVRVAALGDGFDEALHVGEDVDLLWRLHAAGWQVRYEPAVTVAHEHRVRFRAWFARRITYNMSNATLLRRHPGRVPALSISRSSAAFWGALAAGWPLAAGAVTAVSTVILRRTLRRHVPGAAPTAARLIAQSHLHEGRHLARTLSGPWLPFLLAATALRPRLARRLWLGVAAGAIAEWADARHEPTPLHYALPRAADDLARCIGVWRGCWHERSARALLPQLRRR
jgi:mycofactocin system glycosyltransferase